MTKKAFTATRRASERLVWGEAFRVMLRNISPAPGGLTTGKSAASTSKKVSTRPSLRGAQCAGPIVRPIWSREAEPDHWTLVQCCSAARSASRPESTLG
jgi:hypothetical protein